MVQSTAEDTTTGGWQMDSPETDVGSGKGGLCRAPEAREGDSSKERIHRLVLLCQPFYVGFSMETLPTALRSNWL